MPFFEFDIFINAPFDETYKPIFNSIVFAVIRYGYRVRCALEVDNAAENRFKKICDIIAECKFGIHDISRTEVSGSPPLPRFNMPLELGLFLGARVFGDREQKTKSCLIFDREPHRYHRFISDISGQDIHAHGNKARTAVDEVTAWLRRFPGGAMPGGGAAVWKDYQIFSKEMRAVCTAANLRVAELSFTDFHGLVADYVAKI